MSKTNVVLTVIAAIVLVGAGVVYMTTPEDRSIGQKVEDAANSLDDGVDDAARQLEDRTPAEKLSDSIDDATDGNSN